MKKILGIALIALVVPALTACGPEWERQLYKGVPYERTAGSGVQYVLAKMMPKKGTVLKSETQQTQKKVETTIEDARPMETIAPAPALPAEIAGEDDSTMKSGETVFIKHQKK